MQYAALSKLGKPNSIISSVAPREQRFGAVARRTAHSARDQAEMTDCGSIASLELIVCLYLGTMKKNASSINAATGRARRTVTSISRWCQSSGHFDVAIRRHPLTQHPRDVPLLNVSVLVHYRVGLNYRNYKFHCAANIPTHSAAMAIHKWLHIFG